MNERGWSGIEVTGHGSVSVPPDVLRLTMGVSVLRDSVASARAEAARLSSAVAAAMRSMGVADHDLQTTRFSVHPEYHHTDRRRVLEGYRVTSTIAATLRDLDRAGETIDSAISAGGTETIVDHVVFDVEDAEAAQRAARDVAWHDALARATQLADLAGRTLGPARWISEGGRGAPPIRPMMRAAAMETATPIESGTNEVTVALDVGFSLES